MFQNEKTLVKEITSPEGETEFQIRYIKEEGVGLATTRSGKNYLILDSLDYWFDCIQERYPPKRKCPCKNDYFRLRFSYTPRAGTEDFRSVSITSVCTSCGKERQIGEIDLKYSPTDHLFTQPLTFCPKPKIKYKLNSIHGYWDFEVFRDFLAFLEKHSPFTYGSFWTPEKRWEILPVEKGALLPLLFEEKQRYFALYFSLQPIDTAAITSLQNLWRIGEIIQVNNPIQVCLAGGQKEYYSVECCCQYIEAGRVKAKSPAFCALVQGFLSYAQTKLQ